MSATITINDDSLRHELNRLNQMGLSMGRVLKVETRRLLKDILRLTHPDNKAQGETALKSDLRKLFMPLDPGAMALSKRLIKQGKKSGKVSAVDYVPLWTKGNKVYGTMRENFKPDMGEQEMGSVHESKRIKGVISGMGHAKISVITGKLTLFNRIIVKRSNFKRYERSKLTHVGKMRAGFAQGLKALGESVPSWVSRNIGPAVGYTIANINDGNAKPGIIISNQSPGAAEKMGKTVQWAVNARSMAIAKNIARMVKHGQGKSGDYGYATE